MAERPSTTHPRRYSSLDASLLLQLWEPDQIVTLTKIRLPQP